MTFKHIQSLVIACDPILNEQPNKTKPLQRLVYINRVMTKYIRITIIIWLNGVRFLKSLTMYKRRM